MPRPSRRSLILIAAAAALPAAAAPRTGGGRLRARPSSTPGAGSPPEGVTPLGVRSRRDVLIYAPRGARGPLPLLVLLHGAGGAGGDMIAPFRSRADALGFAIL